MLRRVCAWVARPESCGLLWGIFVTWTFHPFSYPASVSFMKRLSKLTTLTTHLDVLLNVELRLFAAVATHSESPNITITSSDTTVPHSSNAVL